MRAPPKTFVHYNKTTGEIVGAVTGVIKTDKNGRHSRVGPDLSKIPENIGQIVLDGNPRQAEGKKVNVQTLELEDKILTGWELFAAQWPLRKIVAAFDSPEGIEELRTALNNEDVQAEKNTYLKNMAEIETP